MTNYEMLIKNMTPELMADICTALIEVNGERLFYLTSTGQLFPMEKHEQAVKFQYNWLMSEAEESPEETSSDNVTD